MRLATWIGLVCLILGGQIAWFVLLRGERILHSDPLLIGGHLVFSGALIAMLWLLRNTPPDAIKLRPNTSNRIILLGTVVLQATAVALLWPGLSEDIVRYRLEGHMWLSGISPYAYSPEMFMAMHPEKVDVMDQTITYPWMQTIYPPLAQAFFTAGRGIEAAIPVNPVEAVQGESWRTILAELPWWHRGAAFRILIGAAAVIATAMLLRMLQEMERSPWYAALAAWHPLSIVECGGMGHVDILGVLLILGALLDAQRARYNASALWLALSIAVKPQAVLLLPFIWRNTTGEDRWLMPVTVLGIAGFLYAAAFIYQEGSVGWSQTAVTYARHWEANGSVYEVIKAVVGGNDDHQLVFAKRLARMIPPIVVVIIGGLLWWRRATPSTALYWLILTLLLAGPVIYPWYLLWMLWMIPLLPLRMGWTGLTWAAMVVISYLLWHQPTWNLPLWAALVQYVPVYLVLAGELTAVARRWSAGLSDPRPIHS